MLAWFLNQSVLVVEEIPYSIISEISISISETWLIYLIIFSGWLFLAEKRKQLLVPCLVLCILLASFQVYEKFKELNQKTLMVYNVRGEKAIDIITGTRDVIIADSTLVTDESKMLFHITHNRWARGLTKPFVETTGKNFFLLNDKTIYILDKRIPYSAAQPGKIQADYLILSGNIYQSIKKLKEHFDFGSLIIDSSYPKYRSDKIKSEGEREGISIYTVADEGAFIKEF